MKKQYVTLLAMLFAGISFCVADDFVAKYKVGDTGPGDGIVFYVSKEGFTITDGYGEKKVYHYLEVSKTDLTTDEAFITFCPCTEKTGIHKETEKLPFPKNESYWGNDREKLFTGKAKTYDFVRNMTHPGGAPNKQNCAAQLCYTYTTATTQKGDWYLPCENEMLLLYISSRYMMDTSILYNPMREYKYWTFYGVMDFCDGHFISYERESQFSVRAIHAF
ncbi:MAG: hypothetical protein IKR40_11470 [Treponema sp.]|nr:hypothetical protein [Treponema sp.]